MMKQQTLTDTWIVWVGTMRVPRGCWGDLSTDSLTWCRPTAGTGSSCAILCLDWCSYSLRHIISYPKSPSDTYFRHREENYFCVQEHDMLLRNFAFNIIVMQNSILPFGRFEVRWIMGFLCAIKGH